MNLLFIVSLLAGVLLGCSEQTLHVLQGVPSNARSDSGATSEGIADAEGPQEPSRGQPVEDGGSRASLDGGPVQREFGHFEFCEGTTLHVPTERGLLSASSDAASARRVLIPASTDLNKPNTSGRRATDPSLTIAATARGGRVLIREDGAFEYTPANGVNSDAFDYEIIYQDGSTTSGRVTLSGAPLPTPLSPLIRIQGKERYQFSPEEALLPPDTCASLGLLNPLAATLRTERGGTVKVSSDGSLTYRPLLGSWGEDSFEYNLQLDGGLTIRRRLKLVLSPSNLKLDDLASLSTGGVFELREGIAHPSALSLAGGGDFNGDGFDDLVIGATGLAYVVFGQASPTLQLLERVREKQIGGFALKDSGSPDTTGWATNPEYFAAAGDSDFNGDGLSDFALAIPGAAGGFGVAELVYFIRPPGPSGLVELAPVRIGNSDGFSVIYSDEPGDGWAPIGRSIAPVGDFNGDGLDDLLVTSGSYSGNASEAYVVFGQASSGESSAATVAPLANVLGRPSPGPLQGTTFDLAGIASGVLTVAGAGDVNQDGVDDALFRRGTERSEDRVYLALGDRGSEQQAVLTVASAPAERVRFWEGEHTGDEAGRALAGNADFNGDGYTDIAIGAPGAAAHAGRVYVLFGSASGFAAESNLAAVGDTVPGFVIDGDNPTRIGANLVALGDINADGMDDLLIGTEVRPGHGTSYIYVVYGRSEATAQKVSDLRQGKGGFAINSPSESAIGSVVSSAGDVNGDGFDDFAFGVPTRGAYGSTFVFLGGNFTGHARSGGHNKLSAKNGGEPDYLVGGLGNNTLISDGGSDVLLGGPGDDLFLLGERFRRIRGGRGTDTIKLTLEDATLDLTTLPPLALSGIEVIDTRGAGRNVITLNESTLRRLPSSLRTTSREFALRIVGDPTDRVVFEGGCPEQGQLRALLQLETILCK